MNLNDYPLWTALITPFLENGELDESSFISLLKEQEKANNGVLILGSTGEGLALTLEEKQTIVRLAAAQNLNVPLMVGVGGFNLNECLDWVDFCDGYVSSYLLVTPLYAKPGPVGQFEWFSALLDQAKKPCMLYNVPSRAGIELNLDAFAKLAPHKNCWALKEASGSVDKFKQYFSVAGETRLYSGDDGLTYDFCVEGGKGLVSVMANVWPDKTHEFTKLCLAKKEDKMWPQIADTLFEAANPIPTKRILKKLGRISFDTLKAPLTAKELPDLSQQLEANEKVNNWSNN